MTREEWSVLYAKRRLAHAPQDYRAYMRLKLAEAELAEQKARR